MRKIVRLTESDLNRILRRVINEQPNEAFDPPKHQMTDNKFIKKTIERLEDGYMKRDWIMVREVISDLKQKLRN